MHVALYGKGMHKQTAQYTLTKASISFGGHITIVAVFASKYKRRQNATHTELAREVLRGNTICRGLQTPNGGEGAPVRL